MKCLKSRWFLGSAPDPVGGAYGAPPNPLVGRGFLPSALAASQGLPPLEIKSGYAPVCKPFIWYNASTMQIIKGHYCYCLLSLLSHSYEDVCLSFSFNPYCDFFIV